MTTPDHLHPARPKYLRRGTPVSHVYVEWDDDNATQCGHVDGFVSGASGERQVIDTTGNVWHDVQPEDMYLDLRDPTARAHAAMAWTVVDANGGGVALALTSRRTGMGEADTHRRILMRMRALDPSVTPAEARAALLWAESVVSP